MVPLARAREIRFNARGLTTEVYRYSHARNERPDMTLVVGSNSALFTNGLGRCPM
jgi:hypothetical protein